MTKLYEQAIHGELNFSTCIEQIQQNMRALSIKLCEDLFQTIEEHIFESPQRRCHYRVHRSHDQKIMSTLLGEVTLTRRYYQHKANGDYTYLLADFLFITPHQRIDLHLEAALYQSATEQSYQKTVQLFPHVGIHSRQTVKNIVHRYSPDSLTLPTKEKREAACLYIEADEDHVACQDGKNRQMRLVYVHEGYESDTEESNRLKLNVSRRFTGLYEDSEEIWEDVAYYLDQQYDLKATPTVFLSGDGASWIRKGLDYLPPQTQFVLDPYHTMKYLRQACVGIPTKELYGTLHEWLYSGKKGYLNDYFNVRMEDPFITDSMKATLRKSRHYLLGHFDAIQRQRDSQYIGCSAEGHVSHYLSKRLSSRPLGWSKTGAENIAKGRIYVLNGVDLKTWVFRQAEEVKRERRVEKLDGRIGRKYVERYNWEVKIPLLHYSNRTRSRQGFNTLKGYCQTF